MNVFISGTKKNVKITGEIKAALDALIARGAAIVIGDCWGVDRCVQEYLAAAGYRNVTVYASGDTARNNAGSWPEVHVDAGGTTRGYYFYKAKDVAMADAADCALVLWDGKSRGTRENIRRMRNRGKGVSIISTLLPLISILPQ